MTTEVIGYIATALTMSSFLFTDMVRLRQVNLVGCLWWIAYALSMPAVAYPVLLVNTFIAGVNLFWLVKNSKHGK